MIERYEKKYELSCDYCSNSEEFEDFQDAIEYKKANQRNTKKLS